MRARGSVGPRCRGAARHARENGLSGPGGRGGGGRPPPPHNAVLLDPAATRMGIATAFAPGSKYKVYWALLTAK